jgi:hypothetical protein
MGGYTSKCEKSQNHCTLMSNLWTAIQAETADELEERQRRIIQSREKRGSHENWSGQDSSLIV